MPVAARAAEVVAPPRTLELGRLPWCPADGLVASGVDELLATDSEPARSRPSWTPRQQISPGLPRHEERACAESEAIAPMVREAWDAIADDFGLPTGATGSDRSPSSAQHSRGCEAVLDQAEPPRHPDAATPPGPASTEEAKRGAVDALPEPLARDAIAALEAVLRGLRGTPHRK